MPRNEHYPDDGNGFAVPAGARATCYHCRRRIVFIAGFDRRHDHWRAFGSFGIPLPKSKRCTSRNPAVGYLGCDLLRNHRGACRGSGYSWWRGKGYSRPTLISRPSWDQA
jgi:hypothetical protein